MIEMDESEYQESAVSDTTLHLVSLFCGPDVRDKLLYRRVDDVRSTNGFPSYFTEKRSDPIECSGDRFFNSQTTEGEGDHTPIVSVDVLG